MATPVADRHLLPWERWSIPLADRHPGPLNVKYGYIATFLFIIIQLFIALLSLNEVWLAAFLPLILYICLTSRMIVVDLMHTIIPNVYTAALAVVGIAVLAIMPTVPWGFVAVSLAIALGLPALLWLMAFILRQPAALGGGDVKMLLALAFWLDPVSLCWAMFAGTVFTLPLLFFSSFRPIPMAPGFAVGALLMLTYGDVIKSWVFKLL